MSLLSSISRAPTKFTAPLSTRLPHHVLSFTLCGEDFAFDLNTLQDDPVPIIEVLKATSSIRGNWMMVAAHYRRTGKVYSAISVVETMMTVMAEQGITEDDLKPALLFLSGCETDLAKLAKASKSGDMEKHYRKAQVLLQKVYGTLDTTVLAEYQDVRTFTLTTSPRPACNTTSNDVGARRKFAHNTTPFKEPRETSLQREVQSLLGELKEKSSMLAEARNAKRQLEDDLVCERDRRRRLSRDYSELQIELTTARKLENSTLAQVKREVEARRRAEEVVRQAKAKQTELESLLGQIATKPLAEIANTMKMEDGSSVAIQQLP